MSLLIDRHEIQAHISCQAIIVVFTYCVGQNLLYFKIETPMLLSSERYNKFKDIFLIFSHFYSYES